MAESAKAHCTTCGNWYDPDDIRGTHPYRHPVNGPIPKKAKEGDTAEPSMQARVQQLPSDPVLRFALIQAGVIQGHDIENAERLLAATGMISTDPREPGSPAWRQEREGTFAEQRPDQIIAEAGVSTEDAKEAATEWARQFNESRNISQPQTETRLFDGKMDGDLELWLGDSFESWLPAKDSDDRDELLVWHNGEEVRLSRAQIIKEVGGPILTIILIPLDYLVKEPS